MAELPKNDQVEQVFNAMAEYDPTAIEEALPLTAKGSFARDYMGYQLASVNAAIDGGTPLTGAPATKINKGYKSCDVDEKGVESCVAWDHIEGRAGKIVNFKVGGKELKDRLTTGNGAVLKAGELATAQFLYAYQGVQSNALFVLVRVRSGANKININSYDAKYRDPTGRQFKASSTNGPTDLAPRSTATLAIAFVSAKPGGAVTLPFASQNFETIREVLIKTR